MSRGAIHCLPSDARLQRAEQRAPWEHLRDSVLRQHWPVGSDLLLCVDAPRASAEALLDGPSPWSLHTQSQASVLWASGDETVVGLGRFAEKAASGRERFAILRDWGKDVLARLVVGPSTAQTWLPRVFCGFAFSDQEERCPAWRPFGEAYGLVPRFSYVQRPVGAMLCMLIADRERHHLDDCLAELRGLHEHLMRLPAPSLEGGLAPDQIHIADQAHWNALVDTALSAIHAGALGKVVAARCARLTFPRPLSRARTMAALAASHPDSTRFVFALPSSSFVGATPERLLRKRALHIDTEALAGTFSHPTHEAPASARGRFTADGTKERREHLPVLDAIIETLGPLCSELQYAAQPELRALKHVLHLRTAIEGNLKQPTHILDLVERLHPTPAVGGVPAQAAMQWIVANEGFSRGWYAGPLGWFDRDGDGQFDVALRSGILNGREALLFAGAGIVKDSHPEREFAETELKLLALQSALRTLD